MSTNAETLLITLGRRYRPALMAFFVRRLSNSAEAEDLTQEVLLKLIELPADEIRNPEAYIFRMASNLVRDGHRRRQVRDSYRAEQAEIEERAADYIDPLRLLEGKEKLGLVSAAMAGLSQRTRDILLLFRVERMRKRDIAESFGISVSAVDKHLIRATAQLAKCLEDEA
jgi:RNA polymerase sigma-70 factor (ECF subfamily)